MSWRNSVTEGAPGLSPRLLDLRDALTAIDERPAALSRVLPIATKSEANLREHWARKAGRAKSQRTTAKLAMGKVVFGGRLAVLVTRLAPRELDGDNLQRALKAVVDGLADALGLSNDRDPSVVWVYNQARGSPAVRVDLFPLLPAGRTESAQILTNGAKGYPDMGQKLKRAKTQARGL